MAKQRSTAQNWKGKATPSGETEELELPSGNVCLIRRVGPEVFLSMGFLPDSLTAEVERAVKSKKGLPPSALQNLASDPKQLGDLMEMMDRILCFAVVDPKVEMPPRCETGIPGAKVGQTEPCNEYAMHERHVNPLHENTHAFNAAPRKENVLYADQVDLEDKMFIMNVTVGGTRDYERFRKERESVMAGISARKNVGKKTE